MESLEQRCLLATFTVNSTSDEPDADINDNVCATTFDLENPICSLRAAIDNANRSAGPHRIEFETLIVDDGGTPDETPLTIHVENLLPAIAQQVTIDGETDVGRTTITGPEESGLGAGHGLQIIADGSTVRALIVRGFVGSGIALQNSDNHLVEYVDLLENRNGLLLQSVNSALARDNVLKDNRESGVRIEGGGGNTLQGSFAESNDQYGVRVLGSAGNVIGGPGAGEENGIVLNGFGGVRIEGPTSLDNRIENNYIGVFSPGLTAAGNLGPGVSLNGAGDNIVGGDAAGLGNIISANAGVGVELIGNGGHIVAGNKIGLADDGVTLLPNIGNGVHVGGSTDNRIGGVAGVSGNVITGNTGRGVAIEGAGATNNSVVGNLIGLFSDGSAAPGNSQQGVFIAAPNNRVGGPGDNGNVISGNTGAGVMIATSDASGNVVQHNIIGASVDGASAMPNGFGGILITNAPNNVVGGTQADEGNLISGNAAPGVAIDGALAVGNRLEGNAIGVQLDLQTPLPNELAGVFIGELSGSGAAGDNTIGGTDEGAGNLIAFNNGPGVAIGGGTGNAVRRNSIFDNTGLGIDLGNDGPTPNDPQDADSGPNNLQNFPLLHGITVFEDRRIVEGSLDGVPNTTYIVEFYSDELVESGPPREGGTFIGTKIVTTDADGNARFRAEQFDTTIGTLPLTATATGPDNSTSEFSAALFPKLVHVLTHGFNPNPFDFEGFREDYRNLYPALLADLSVGKLFEDAVGTYVTSWDSSTGWVQAAVDATALATSLATANAPLAALSSLRLFTNMQRARQLAEEAARTIVSDLQKSILGDPELLQTIHLIGHSRGGAVNARATQLLADAGYLVDQYTALDGFSTDWPNVSGLLGDIPIADRFLDVPAAKKLNYRVEQPLAAAGIALARPELEIALESVLQTFLGVSIDITIDPNAVPQLLDWRAPLRSQAGFEDLLIVGNDPAHPSNHLNVTELYFSSPNGYLFNSPLGVAPLPPPNHSEEASGEGPDAQIPPPFDASSFGDVFDGSIEIVGDLWRQTLAADFSSLSDDLLVAWSELASNPDFLLDSVWDAQGQVDIVIDGDNTALRLAQASDASIGQYVVLDPRARFLAFDLEVENAGADDELQVLFGETVLQTIDLSSAPAVSQVEVLLDSVAGQDGQLRFLLTGPGETPAAIVLDNIDVVTELEIGALTADPEQPLAPEPVEITADDISDPDGVLASVSFFLETNGQPGLQPGVGGDLLLGDDSDGSDGYTATFDTTGLSGQQQVYALALDGLGGAGPAASLIVNITSPNVPPTLDVIDDLTINEDAPQTVNLSGIGTGGESQPLSVVATSSDPTLIPHPTEQYSDPDTTGSIQFRPAANQTGSADITVTVTDGGADGDLNTPNDNGMFSRSFTVIVQSIHDWQNQRDPRDINDDTIIAPDDVLAIINTILADGSRPLPEIVDPPPFFYDATGDDFVAADDALIVINALILPAPPSEQPGEGEATAFLGRALSQETEFVETIAGPSRDNAPPAIRTGSAGSDAQLTRATLLATTPRSIHDGDLAQHVRLRSERLLNWLRERPGLLDGSALDVLDAELEAAIELCARDR